MTYILYGDKGSGAFCVEAALAEAGAPYEFQRSRWTRTSRNRPHSWPSIPAARFRRCACRKARSSPKSAAHPADRRRTPSASGACCRRRPTPDRAQAPIAGSPSWRPKSIRWSRSPIIPSASRRRAKPPRRCGRRRATASANGCLSSSRRSPGRGPAAGRLFACRHLCRDVQRAGSVAAMAAGESAEDHCAGRRRRSGRPSRRSGRGISRSLKRRFSSATPCSARKDFSSSALEHLADDVAAADEFALHIKLRDGRPVGEFLDALADLRVLQHVDGFELHAQMRKDLHHGGGETALRKHRRALHEKDHGIVLHFVADAALIPVIWSRAWDAPFVMSA